MECSRKDLSQFNASTMEDCCRPDRGGNAPAEELLTSRSKTELEHAATGASLLSQLSFQNETHRNSSRQREASPTLIHAHPESFPSWFSHSASLCGRCLPE